MYGTSPCVNAIYEKLNSLAHRNSSFLIRTSKPLQAIIFDVDGTLFDSRDAFYMLVRDFFTERGWTLRPRDEIISLIGKTNVEIANELFPVYVRRDRRLYEMSLVEIERRWVENYLPTHVKLVPGVDPLLRDLRRSGFKLGVASNGSAREIPVYLKQGRIDSYFDVVVTADDVKRPKPFPDPLLLAIKKLNVLPSRTLYVGDTLMDAKTARAAGTLLALVLSGVGKPEELRRVKPDILIYSVKDLSSALASFLAST